VLFNKDSSRVGPAEWVLIARALHAARPHFDAFVIVHGTDTMAYTASALSLLLAGFRKPIILTGSQLPLAMPRSDARQNLIDALTTATSSFNPPHVHCPEVCICFGGVLLRGNRSRKTNASSYSAFSSPGYPPLAQLGVDVGWNTGSMLSEQQVGAYRPRFKLDPRVLRVPIVPGCDPRVAYGDVFERGVRGVILEAFGVGNMPDLPSQGWLPWLRQQRRKGLLVYLSSQCGAGALHPELYRSGSVALELGVTAGPQMTPETAVVKMMLSLAHPDLPLQQPIAGEM
jgi:L-asparaginase